MPAATPRCMQGPELRTIFLGFDQYRDELQIFQREGQEPLQGRARAQGVLSGDRRGGDRRQGHARSRDALRADDLAAAVRPRRRISSDRPTDPDAGQEAARRGRLPQRLRGDDGLPERPLRQRRGDLPGRRRDARPRRHQDQPARPAEGQILRQGPGFRRLRHLVLSARLDAGLVRLLERARQHVSLPRREGQRRQQQCRQLLQSQDGGADQDRSWWRPTRRSATS